jgi:hypothetical protein
MVTSVRGEAAPERGNVRMYNASWTDVNLNVSKIKKIHVVDSVAINGP